ncbi:YTH domain [Dillenia turbinata]|uniref:YTH domain-containing family protein n=1 Tax=Dillenia turbinata TaxID=194707 RepID=A0AAN8W7P4_9MAGN
MIRSLLYVIEADIVKVSSDMSTDSVDEDASVVDSSVTEWRHDAGNWDEPESSRCKANEDGFDSRAEEQLLSPNRDGNSRAVKRAKVSKTRYFIMKSLNHRNIQLSIERGIWATQVMNEPILEEAFHNSDKVILIFSVNMSGFFQGYAQMMSSIGWRRDNIWSQGTGGGNPWGRSFKVKWLQLNDLPFQKTLHLKNPLNDYKPVKISRDCQELSQDIGEALLELLDGKIDVEDKLESKNFVDCLPSRPYVDPSCSGQTEEFNIPPAHMTWPQLAMLYPSILYQHRAKSSQFCLPSDAWCLSAERSAVAGTLSEDDFLEMSYEEYLEVHSRSSKQLCRPKAGQSRRRPESKVKMHEDGSICQRSLTDQGHSNKRTNRPSHKVKQSAALNRPGAENMKPRKVSDAIHAEVGHRTTFPLTSALFNEPGAQKAELKLPFAPA